MINIIRNCSHFSSVCTGLELDESGVPSFVMRKTFLPQGVLSLETEARSIKWYCNKAGVDPSSVLLDFIHSNSYAALKLKFQQGTLGKYTDSIFKNQKRLSNLIDYYSSVFCGNDVYSHGDLSLGNVLFENDKVLWIIDWENANRMMPREYDLVYCITENCLFRLVIKRELSKQEIEAYRDLFKKIENKIDVDSSIKNNPTNWCRNVALDYMKNTGIEHSKCPFVAYDKEIINKLDALLTS